MNTSFFKPLVSLLFVSFSLLASACQDVPPIERKPLSFRQYLPIHMAVSKIDMVEEYQSTMQPPYVEHRIPYSPAEAMDIWVKQRLRPVGLENSLQVIIKDASVKATEVPGKSGWNGLFVGKPDTQYDAVLEVELRIYGSSGAMSLANVSAKATRSITLPASMTIQDRDEAFRRMVESLMTIINAQLEKNMYMFMSDYISFSYNP